MNIDRLAIVGDIEYIYVYDYTMDIVKEFRKSWVAFIWHILQFSSFLEIH